MDKGTGGRRQQPVVAAREGLGWWPELQSSRRYTWCQTQSPLILATESSRHCLRRLSVQLNRLGLSLAWVGLRLGLSCEMGIGWFWFWVRFGIGFGFGSVWVKRLVMRVLGGKVGSVASELVPPSLIRCQVSNWGVYRCPSLSVVKRSETVAQG